MESVDPTKALRIVQRSYEIAPTKTVPTATFSEARILAFKAVRVRDSDAQRLFFILACLSRSGDHASGINQVGRLRQSCIEAAALGPT